MVPSQSGRANGETVVVVAGRVVVVVAAAVVVVDVVVVEEGAVVVSGIDVVVASTVVAVQPASRRARRAGGTRVLITLPAYRRIGCSRTGPELLVQAIHAAAAGDALVAPNITARLLEAFSRTQPAASAAQPVDPLTEREEEILVEVAGGRTNAEIADDLFISLSTVKTHIASLMTKLEARNRVEVAMWAYETGRM